MFLNDNQVEALVKIICDMYKVKYFDSLYVVNLKKFLKQSESAYQFCKNALETYEEYNTFEPDELISCISSGPLYPYDDTEFSAEDYGNMEMSQMEYVNERIVKEVMNIKI